MVMVRAHSNKAQDHAGWPERGSGKDEKWCFDLKTRDRQMYKELDDCLHRSIPIVPRKTGSWTGLR